MNGSCSCSPVGGGGVGDDGANNHTGDDSSWLYSSYSLGEGEKDWLNSF